MSTIQVADEPLATSVHFEDHWLIVDLSDGRRICVPIEWFDRLRRASPVQRADWRLIGDGEGIHWPAVDEDICVGSLLAPALFRSETPTPLVSKPWA